MTDPSDRLASALANRYRIEREIGSGGVVGNWGGEIEDLVREGSR
jgi:hypothetical protein